VSDADAAMTSPVEIAARAKTMPTITFDGFAFIAANSRSPLDDPVTTPVVCFSPVGGGVHRVSPLNVLW
jgi:hypothetical protein